MANLGDRLKLIGSKKRCNKNCFHYEPSQKGCSYTSMDFNVKEKVEPGQKCLHPEFSEAQITSIPIIDLCNALASNYTEVD